MDEKLLQNTLAEATTEQGFPTKTGLPVRREVTLETGETVMVESVVPEVMATVLGSHFVTPGEKYLDNGKNLNGVVQNYNGNVPNHIETRTLPTKLNYFVGEELDLTGMEVIKVEEDGDVSVITDYTVDIAGRPLTLEDTRATVSYQGLEVYFTITVSEPEPELVSIAVTTPPTKVNYQSGDTFDPTGMVVTATYDDETTEEITDYTYEPSSLAIGDSIITISYEGKTTTQAITVIKNAG